MSCFMSVNCFTTLAYKKTFSLRNHLVFFSKCLKNDHINAESTVQFWILFEAEHMRAYTCTPLQFYTADPLCTILSKNLHNLLQTLNRDLYSV